jgi:hypothetical protein
MRDPKNQFYRTLNLDEDSKMILKWYRKNIKDIKNSADKKVKIIKEEND